MTNFLETPSPADPEKGALQAARPSPTPFSGSAGSDIESIVMRRVHTIHILRPFVSGGAFAMVVGALALYGIGREVWVARVFENAPPNFALLPQFYLSAFTHTDLAVQALTVLALVSVVYLARETAKLISKTLVPILA